MNDMLVLKGAIMSAPNKSAGSNYNIGKSMVTFEKIDKYIAQLRECLKTWSEDLFVEGILISVHYKRIVPKSKRVRTLFKENSRSSNSSIVGARFDKSDGIHKHVITHYISKECLRNAIILLEDISDILKNNFENGISQQTLGQLGKITRFYTKTNKAVTKNSFLLTLMDLAEVDSFSVDEYYQEPYDMTTLTLFRTNISISDLFDRIGLKRNDYQLLNDCSVTLTKEVAETVLSKVPHLVAQTVSDFNLASIELGTKTDFKKKINIPRPTNEPTIGVIDTLFDDNCEISQWVENISMLDPNIPVEPKDYHHGTAVTSLVVAGPLLNPDYDDNCGYFKVRHFGVATNNGFSSSSIMRSIDEIIKKNRDIRVWNLSLGSEREISDDFISLEGATLDKLQEQYDVIFIVAGTNKKKGIDHEIRIGSPADSIHSIVVNSVDRDKNMASYSRVGPVLSFFHKPDVSYYGGDMNGKMNVIIDDTVVGWYGTSLAAPWISRKVAYLMHKVGLSRELAKALILDSAAGWKSNDKIREAIGYGVVPIKIEDVINCRNDEIRFAITGRIDSYETFAHNIPVPIVKDSFPWLARATLCYFPKSSRNQGVDYTLSELEMSFGRVKKNAVGNMIVDSINRVKREYDLEYLKEKEERSHYRKWDSVKYISDDIKLNSKPRKVYERGMWGISLKKKERLDGEFGVGMNYGIVVTLKEMNGVNRNSDFIKLCINNGWIVNRINLSVQNEIYNLSDEEIVWD